MEVILPLLAEELWDGRKKARRMQINQNLQFTEMGSSSHKTFVYLGRLSWIKSPISPLIGIAKQY